jgi:glycosyltransferase involved in cell wall biosynthesis
MMGQATAPVSVVIPVRNGAAFIGEALNCVLAQTVVPREIIVVDDGSTDLTSKVVHHFARVGYVKQPPLGVSAARNAGAERAIEPYLCFLDADDLWTPTKTERQLAAFDRDPGVDIVVGLMQNFRRDEMGEMMFLTNPAAAKLPGALMMRRSAFRRAGPYSPALAYGENLEWWARAVDSGLRTETIAELVLMRRIHRSNTSRDAEKPVCRYLGALHAITRRRREQSNKREG